MKNFNTTDLGVVFKEVSEGGKAVTIVAEPMGLAYSEWRLAIRGKNNQFTNWTDFFSTSESAIKTGLAAIKKEGLTQFYSSPDCKAFL